MPAAKRALTLTGMRKTNLDVAPTLNKWLAALGIALWLLAPAAVESGRLDPPLADTIFAEGK